MPTDEETLAWLCEVMERAHEHKLIVLAFSRNAVHCGNPLDRSLDLKGLAFSDGAIVLGLGLTPRDRAELADVHAEGEEYDLIGGYDA